mmetsp:Transcript_25577/g.38075  ORF Transcript_25577/g.38075 Transcript_25577/m.38075 type:complete len:114 (-) Transcript_25577:19-360(-)
MIWMHEVDSICHSLKGYTSLFVALPHITVKLNYKVIVKVYWYSSSITMCALCRGACHLPLQGSFQTSDKYDKCPLYRCFTASTKSISPFLTSNLYNFSTSVFVNSNVFLPTFV